jgi:hypothetical protein
LDLNDSEALLFQYLLLYNANIGAWLYPLVRMEMSEQIRQRGKANASLFF